MNNDKLHHFWCDICKEHIKGNKAEQHSAKHIKNGDFDLKIKKEKYYVPPTPPNVDEWRQKLDELKTRKGTYSKLISSLDKEITEIEFKINRAKLVQIK